MCRFRNPRRTRAGVSLFGSAGFSQGWRRSGDERAGKAELGVGGDHQPGPAVGRRRVAQAGPGPAEGLLEQTEGVLQVEAAEERLPAAVDVGRAGTGTRPPQPDRPVHPAAGQLLDGEPDHRAFEERQLAVAFQPCRPAGQPGVKPAPGPGRSGAVAAGCRGGDRLFGAPGGGVAEHELAAVLGRPAPGRIRGGELRAAGRRAAHHPVRTEPAEDLHRQVAEQVRDPRGVVAGRPSPPAPPDRPPSTAPRRSTGSLRRGVGQRWWPRRRRRAPAAPRPAPPSTTFARSPARPRTSTASPGSSGAWRRRGRRCGRTSGPGRSRRPAAATARRPPPIPGGRRRPAAAAGRRAPTAADRRPPGPGSARRTGHRARAGAQVRAPGRPGSSPARRCTGPRPSARTARRPIRQS